MNYCCRCCLSFFFVFIGLVASRNAACYLNNVFNVTSSLLLHVMFTKIKRFCRHQRHKVTIWSFLLLLLVVVLFFFCSLFINTFTRIIYLRVGISYNKREVKAFSYAMIKKNISDFITQQNEIKPNHQSWVGWKLI